MAYSIVRYVGDGTTKTFAIPFPYLADDTSYIHAFVDGVENTDVTFPTKTQVTFPEAPPADSVVSIQRITPRERLVNYQDGATFTEEDMDLDSNQLIYLEQEALDFNDTALTQNESGNYDAQGARIVNVGTPVDDSDAATKAYADAESSRAASAANSAETSATNAADSANAAASSEAKAEQWADADEDVEVEPGLYSAKHWALKAEETSTASGVSFADNDKGFTATDVQAAIEEVGSGYNFVNVKAFGAVGDGVTDDTAAIQNAINAGKVVYFPEGKYVFNNTIVLDNQTLIGASRNTELHYIGAISAIDLQSDGKLADIYVTKPVGWNQENPISGIRFLGSQARAEDVSVREFDIGLHFLGDDQGAAYNFVTPRYLVNNFYNVVFEALGSGWSNENIVLGGRIDINSGRRTGDTYGVFMDDSNSTNKINNNKIIGLAIENVGTIARICGTYNSFIAHRAENREYGNKIIFRDTQNGLALWNYIIGGVNQTYIYEDVNGNVMDRTRGNFIMGRGHPFVIGSESIQLQASGGQKVFINYNASTNTIDFIMNGNKICELTTNGNLRITGVLQENTVF